MIVEILDDRGHPLRIPASRVVVRDSNTNTPIAVAVEFTTQGYIVATANDKDFQKTLRSIGVLESILVTEVSKNDISLPSVR